MGLGFFIEMSMLALQGLYDNTFFHTIFLYCRSCFGVFLVFGWFSGVVGFRNENVSFALFAT